MISLTDLHKAIYLILPAILLSTEAAGQTGNVFECLEINQSSVDRITEDLRHFASTDMNGRLAGSEEEEMIINYLIEGFSALGLQPYGDNYEWVQRVPMNRPVQSSEETSLRWKKFNPKLGAAFYPTYMSSNDTLKMRTRYVRHGIEAPELEYSDYRGRKKRLKKRIAVIDLSHPEAPIATHPLAQPVKKRVEAAIAHGAKGVILINPDLHGTEPAKEFEHIESFGVPVVVLRNPKMVKRLEKWWGKRVNLLVHQEEKEIYANNLWAYMDNGAAFTILITANMDHIGKGNRFSRAPGSNLIHPGADNNASGLAGLMELARKLTENRDALNFNFLFVALSGSYTGQEGAKAVAAALPRHFEGQAVFAINYNMIGRLDDERKIEIQGLGSFDQDFMPTFKHKIDCYGIEPIIRGNAPGRGNHHAFLEAGIPAINITTGMHDDYNLPSDEFGKLNLAGIAEIVSLTYIYLRGFEIDFKTRFNENFSSRLARPTDPTRVDWGFEANWEHRSPGIKILKIREGGAADRAGLKNGDIITQIGRYDVKDVYNFMDYLHILQPGEKRFIRYSRDGKIGAAVIDF
ncbi:MAG: M28 family peptidase [Flavobacteriales bacterium]|nr:MAG: M28 family peptidase [Flavobacteriales bacterium]